MRVTALLGIALVAAACSTKEAPPAADTSAAMAPAPAAPAAMTLASVAGQWDTKVMPMDKDTTLTTNVLTATADTSGWSLTQPTGNVVPLHNVTLDGDSVAAEGMGFKSGVRAGMTVKHLRVVYRMQDGKLMGIATAHYETKTADSVRTFRFEGTKK